MSKRNKIIYWVATIWLSLGMLSGGIVQLIGLKVETDMMDKLGYPHYLLIILGLWKIAGVIAILIPGYAQVKEWRMPVFSLQHRVHCFRTWPFVMRHRPILARYY